MSKKTFKQWHYTNTGRAYSLNLTGYTAQTLVDCWYFQQRIIEAKNQRIQELEDALREAREQLDRERKYSGSTGATYYIDKIDRILKGESSE